MSRTLAAGALWALWAASAGCTGAAPTPLDAGARDGEAPAEITEVEVTTSEGAFVIELHHSWAPIGVEHFLELVGIGYYDDTRFFRVIAGFVAQFGISGTPATAAAWNSRTILDDPVRESNLRGAVTFASTSAPDSRSAQLFINLRDNPFLDTMRFAPIGRVTSGMDVVDRLTSEYGEAPDQTRIVAEGNAYLDASFPNLDRIVSARVR